MPLRTSKLCVSFADMLKDTSPQSMLHYFKQYLDCLHALHLIQFWFSVESFKASMAGESAVKDQQRSFERRRKTLTCTIGSSAGDNPRVNAHTIGCVRTSKVTGQDEQSNAFDCVGSGSVGGGGGTTVGDGRDDSSCRIDSVSSGGGSMKTLHRRGTENHMYCNCKFHVSSTSPRTPGEVSGVGSPKAANSQPMIVQMSSQGSRMSPSPTAACNQLVAPDSHSTKLIVESGVVRIYTKFLSLNAEQSVGVTDEIRQRVEVSICPEDGKISGSCLNESQGFVYDVMMNRYFPGFLHSSFLCKYQLVYIASGNMNLTDFLMGETALSYFMEFMEQEHALFLLQFWLMSDHFHNQLTCPDHISDVHVDTTDAMVIYSRYLSLQATEPLDMEDSVRLDVENRICDERGPRADSFLRPQIVAFHTMNEVYYAAFKESSIYLRFLNELIHMSNKENELTQDDHVVTAAAHMKCDTSRSTSTQGRVPTSSVHIQGRDLDDPNSLWERPLLQFRLGFMNEFGEYISEIEPLSTKKDTSHTWSASARVLKKRKKEEELAMGIARNIVKEIINNLNIADF